MLLNQTLLVNPALATCNPMLKLLLGHWEMHAAAAAAAQTPAMLAVLKQR